MSEDQKRVLEQQLWNIANTLRGKMNADEFRDYILGFIFYKYLSEKMEIFANEVLKQDHLVFRQISPTETYNLMLRIRIVKTRKSELNLVYANRLRFIHRLSYKFLWTDELNRFVKDVG